MKSSKKDIKHQVPDSFQNMEKWETSRRSFLNAAMIAGAASQLAWFTSCSAKLEESNDYLTAEQSTVLKSILLIIFPDDGNGPSADDLNSFGYVIWALGDTFKNKEDIDFIIEGLDWANEMAEELYFEQYIDLYEDQKEALVQNFTNHKWGKPWMSVMISLVLESLMIDPIYGGNKDEQGWKWLQHVAGVPRATEATRFEAFLKKYKPNLA